ncbi:MAG: 5-formyltetrahydrofolate cyclo-ligase [Gordonia sp. (in: high G+C Gram-positive bacteria)]
MTESKTDLRAVLGRRRRDRSAPERAAAACALVDHLARCPFPLAGVTVAAYVPVGTEPGSVAFLDALVGVGARVLLPVVPPGAPGPLDWVGYGATTTLVGARWGLREPVGPPLGVAAITEASVIFVPALAVDVRGVRLGRGAGYYDRTIGGVAAETVAVVYDDEVLEALPAEPYDVGMRWALTPTGGFRRLG